MISAHTPSSFGDLSEGKNLLWLQSGGCGGCSMSLLCAESPDIVTTLELMGVNLLWHPSLSEASNQEFQQLLQDILQDKISLDLLCIEGAMLQGPSGSGRFHVLGGTGLPMIDWVRQLAGKAGHTLAIGSCAAFGGFDTGQDNLTEATGLQFEGEHKGGLLGENYQGREGLSVVNISGCPVHPSWVTETLMQLVSGQASADTLDLYHRPKHYAEQLVHHGCPRNEYYEYKASAEEHGHQGCMMEHLGCLGTQAHGDCNTRLWNGEGSCTRGGYACINCTAPEFEHPKHHFQQTPKLAGIPIGLPTDMPKAWFVALASLSKAATPPRLKDNAVSEVRIIAPTVHTKKRKT
ncbi:HupU protein [Oceanospirillum sediminis]|nr:HupU protein [Oceanospirillum sediminis]